MCRMIFIGSVNKISINGGIVAATLNLRFKPLDPASGRILV